MMQVLPATQLQPGPHWMPLFARAAAILSLHHPAILGVT